MNTHIKKIIAPVIIVLCIIAYHFAGVNFAMRLQIPAALKIIALIFSVVITILFIAVLVERIREIKQGEEDDIGKY